MEFGNEGGKAQDDGSIKAPPHGVRRLPLRR
jgi:hypothetical protein